MPRKINKGVSHKKKGAFLRGTNAITLTPEVVEARAGLIPESDWAEPTNEERANRIPPVLLAYRQARKDGNGDIEDTDPSDMLADLMHYAKREGEDFEHWLRLGYMHFNAEVDEEEDPDPEDVELPGDCESDDANREMGLPEGEDWGNK